MNYVLEIPLLSHCTRNIGRKIEARVFQYFCVSYTYMKKVEIYSTATCHFCDLAKEYFAENNVEYTTHDVGPSGDQAKRAEMVEMTGQLGVPVIRIGDDVVIGFNKEKIAELLEIK